MGAELDLHNMTTETAHTVLLEFIADAQSESLESIRVIHGKGLRSENGPRLKMMTRQVLREHPGCWLTQAANRPMVVRGRRCLVEIIMIESVHFLACDGLCRRMVATDAGKT